MEPTPGSTGYGSSSEPIMVPGGDSVALVGCPHYSVFRAHRQRGSPQTDSSARITSRSGSTTLGTEI